MLKNSNYFFWRKKKNWIATASWARAGAPPQDPRVVTPACDYNFVKCAFSAQDVLLLWGKKSKKLSTANVL